MSRWKQRNRCRNAGNAHCSGAWTPRRVDGEDAIPFLETGFADDFIEGTLYAVLDTLKGAGLIDAICSLGDKLIKEAGDKVYRQALIPIFGTLPGIWSFVPDEYFDEAVRFMNLPAEGGLHDKVFAYRNAMANIRRSRAVA